MPGRVDDLHANPFLGIGFPTNRPEVETGYRRPKNPWALHGRGPDPNQTLCVASGPDS